MKEDTSVNSTPYETEGGFSMQGGTTMDVPEDKRRYGRPHRLEDVLILIQALAATPNTSGQVTENVLSGDNTRLHPQSAESKKWAEIAKEHPEFFRLSGQAEDAIMLVYQYISKAKPSDEMIGKMMENAVITHDREVERLQKGEERKLEAKKLSLTKLSMILSAVLGIGSIIVAVVALIVKK